MTEGASLTRRELREQREAELARTGAIPIYSDAAPADVRAAQAVPSAVQTEPSEPVAERAVSNDVLESVSPTFADDANDIHDAGEAESAAATPRKRSGVVEVFSLIGRGLMVGLLVLILAIGVAAIVVPAATGSTALTVTTSSMEPTLPPGTLIVTRPTPIEDIKPGDVLTFQLKSGESTLVTHRVTQQMRMTDGSYAFVVQGDANPSPDADMVREVQVRGTLWYSIPYIGWVSAALTGPMRLWLVPAIVLGLAGYALFMVISWASDRRKKSAKA